MHQCIGVSSRFAVSVQGSLDDLSALNRPCTGLIKYISNTAPILCLLQHQWAFIYAYGVWLCVWVYVYLPDGITNARSTGRRTQQPSLWSIQVLCQFLKLTSHWLMSNYPLTILFHCWRISNKIWLFFHLSIINNQLTWFSTKYNILYEPRLPVNNIQYTIYCTCAHL